MAQLEGPFIIVDPERCVGCHTCEIACAVAHTPADSVIGAVLTGQRLVPRNRVVMVDQVKLSTQCRQCEDAPCVKVCPTGATYRTETYTAVNTDVCIACKLCMIVCPFGAIHITSVESSKGEKRAATKCDLCVDRPAGPACVEACPTGALSLSQPRETMAEAIEDSSRRYLDALKSKKELSE
jgi:Fe-S-cluster-containing hydrogenase component 2